MEYKNCEHCGKRLPKSKKYFFPIRTTEDGFYWKCIECVENGCDKPLVKSIIKETSRRKLIDIDLVLLGRLRARIRPFIHDPKLLNTDMLLDVLGCDLDTYKRYLEKKFYAEMTWGDVVSGKVHIDHKKPICMFNLSEEKQLRKAFNYKNTQPLWSADHVKKSLKELIPQKTF